MISIIQELNIMIESIYKLIPDSESIEDTKDLELNLKAIEYVKDNIIKSKELYRNYGVSFDKDKIEYNLSVDKLIINQILLNISYFDYSNKYFVKHVRTVIDMLLKKLEELNIKIVKVEYVVDYSHYRQVYYNLKDLYFCIAELSHMRTPYGISKITYYNNDMMYIEDNIII